jgi:hypothetical protein
MSHLVSSSKSDAMLKTELEGLAHRTEKVSVTPTKEAEPPATTSSPDPKEKGIYLGSSGGEPLPNDQNVEGEVDMVDRSVSYSKVYEGADLVPLFVLAIRCGLKAASERSERPLPNHAAQVDGDCALVHPDGLEWKKTEKSYLELSRHTARRNILSLESAGPGRYRPGFSGM